MDISNKQSTRRYAPSVQNETTLDIYVRKKTRKQAGNALKQAYLKTIEGDGDLVRFIGPSINKSVTTYRIIDKGENQLTEVNIYAQRH
jgi:hypothetical protein